MKCDKCGQEVSNWDDIIAMEAIIYGEPFGLFVFAARHIRCSPSRAQYIVHPDFTQVVDDRPEYDKRLRDPGEVAELEAAWTAAWVEAQG